MTHALTRLTSRSQFLAVAATRRKCARVGVVLQARAPRAETGETPFLQLIAAFEDAAQNLARNSGAAR